MRRFSTFAGLMTLILVLQGVIMTASQSAAQQHPEWVRVAEHATFTPRDTAEDAVFDVALSLAAHKEDRHASV